MDLNQMEVTDEFIISAKELVLADTGRNVLFQNANPASALHTLWQMAVTLQGSTVLFVFGSKAVGVFEDAELSAMCSKAFEGKANYLCDLFGGRCYVENASGFALTENEVLAIGVTKEGHVVKSVLGNTSTYVVNA